MIDVKNIYKSFGTVGVLKGVSCTIEKGEKVVIIGPSGSGKSTLLRCMNLLEVPTAGEIWFKDKMITSVDPYLHRDIIEKSKTYTKLSELLKITNPNMTDEQIRDSVIDEIIEKRLLKKHEGKQFKLAIKETFNEVHIKDIPIIIT